jgi:2,3-bisphosphoglycerate-independent phosphoglycerate mutase
VVTAPRALIILDGAAEPVWPWPSTLEVARTPALDALCERGAVTRLATTPDGLAPGSEVGIPTLLGAPPRGPVGRGRVEAAAAGFHVPEDAEAWRIDLHHSDGGRAVAAETRLLLPVLQRSLPEHEVHHLRGHRALAIGARRPAIRHVASLDAHVWEAGEVPAPVLDERTIVIAARGAASGCARLMGARVVIPDGATGDVGSDLRAKTTAALAALRSGTADTVVVHVGGIDEAAHFRDREGKAAMVEAADEDVVAPLARALREAGGLLAVTSDHATCVETGRHGGEPVPAVLAGPRVAALGPSRLHERAVTGRPALASPWAAAEVVA